MDAFELLKADHKKVVELFDQLEAARGKAKLDIFKQIKSELDLHAHIEETIFYPALEKPEETHDLTLEAYEEHKVVKTLLAELSAAKTADDEWQAQAKVLRENVEHHVDEEENELFDKADDALSDEEIEALGDRMEAEKARKEGRPAPKKPDAKATKADKAGAGKPGLLSKIANFVGLGGAIESKGSKKAAKKAAVKKTTARPGSKKATTKKTSSKAAAKSSKSSASKRSSAAKAPKKISASPTGAKKRGSAAKKSAKKRGR
jgi:hemerythrin-like domain-containing protein